MVSRFSHGLQKIDLQCMKICSKTFSACMEALSRCACLLLHAEETIFHKTELPAFRLSLHADTSSRMSIILACCAP